MEYHAGDYDVIVVGAGHAGCEALRRQGWAVIRWWLPLT